MDWDDVRVFRAVASTSSLAHGAREVGMDRSTASRRIAALEEALGARLFLRTREGLRPSALGERLLSHADRMAAQARDFEAEAAEDGGRIGGVVRIATTDALAVLLVREGLLGLTAEHPELSLVLVSGNRAVDLARGEADLALRGGLVNEPSLVVRRVVRLSFSVFAGQRYLERRGRPGSEDALAGHDVLLYGGELESLPESKWLASRPGVRVVFRANSIPALVAAAVEGHGIVVVARAWEEPGLVRLFDVDALRPRSLYLVMHPDAAARPSVRLVAERIAALVDQRKRALQLT